MGCAASIPTKTLENDSKELTDIQNIDGTEIRTITFLCDTSKPNCIGLKEYSEKQALNQDIPVSKRISKPGNSAERYEVVHENSSLPHSLNDDFHATRISSAHRGVDPKHLVEEDLSSASSVSSA
eukprot:GDKK01059098.1.p1 GENE.GDKK01059098.1~~GDKK01059098.1.p1  ORF type:complete len:125 (-),score=21.29 GDKK01059098.1:1384-1758(-)